MKQEHVNMIINMQNMEQKTCKHDTNKHTNMIQIYLQIRYKNTNY